jgi:hypothetical protein
MRLKNVVSFTTLAVFVVTLTMGCGQSSDVPVATAPATAPGAVKPLPKKPQEGGGRASSGNTQRNPGADPLAPRR